MPRPSLVVLSVIGVAVALTAYAKWSSSRNPLRTLPSVGSQLPVFAFQTIANARVSSASLLGAPALLVLWSTTCSASREALVGVEQLFADYSSRGVRIVIIADDTEQRIRAFSDSAHLDIPIAIADGQAYVLGDPSARMALTATLALPTVLLTDARGRLVLRTVGVAQHGSSVRDHPFGAIRAALDSLLRTH